ncbi:MAG: transposase [Gammaproteobacteria bacterium]|nr:transposase [Gammaproteobacteria bacterium]
MSYVLSCMVKGLTTRDLESITQSIYGQQLSRSSISRITQTYKEERQCFRSRQLNQYYPIIYLDATFINTRRGNVSKEAYYIALAVKSDMIREVIGIYNAPTEAASIYPNIFKMQV